MDRDKVVKIGTRGSKLALIQTDLVIGKLQERFPDLKVEKVILHTKGDKILDQPLIDFGGKGVFVTEFEEAIQDGRIDFAVHSSKDMPMELGENLMISGVLERADGRDVLVTRKGISSGIIGTGSLRRQFQLEALFPDYQCKSIRGNVTTRLEKVRKGEYDGVILAAAGLTRLGLLEEEEFDYHYFSYDEMIPAGGQGIIAIEGRKGDTLQTLISEISDTKTWIELEIEREILKLLNAGCHEAIGVFSQVINHQIRVRFVREHQGKIIKKDQLAGVEHRLLWTKEFIADIKAGE